MSCPRVLLPLVALLLTAALAVAAPLTLYVAPDGRDTWSGSLVRPNAARTDGPLASCLGARDRLRELRAAGKISGPVRVEIAPGVYSLSAPLVFQPQDSGTAEAPVTFAGAPGWKTVLSGGRVITGWQQAAPGLWAAPVADAADWPLRSLYVNGERAILARSPNEGYFRTAGKALPLTGPDGKEQDSSKLAFRFKAGEMKNWPDVAGANIIVFYHWETGMMRIKSVDEASQTLVLTGEFKWPFWSNQRYYVENVRAALDAPGEWYLDRAAGRLYYRPRPGENMKTAQVIAPRLPQLVLFQGDPELGTLVSNVRFENLSLRYTNYNLEPEGHCDWQAAVTVNAAVQANGANRCSFANCEFSGLGNYAVWWERGCTDNSVTESYIHDCSAGGVRIGQAGVPSEPNVTRGNEVRDCLIRDVGKEFYGAHPVWIGHASYNTISHNEICEANYTGIACGWSWGYGPSAANHNIIEYNHLHDLGRGRLCDMAAIYTLGIQPGTIIRNNLIHDIYDWAEGYGAGGIYPDEGSSQMLIENNVVYRTASGGLTVHYGQDNICRNNIFAYGRDNQVYLGRRDKQSSLTLDHNIVYYEEGALFSRESDLKSDHNLYWNTAGEEMVFPVNKTFAEWQAAGQDVGSVIADPKFRNPAKDDFTLRPDSPALALGFKPIDTSTCGVTQPAALVKLANSLRRPPGPMPRRASAPPLSLNDNFETTPVGAGPDLAVVYGEQGVAKIRVTDETAASGKHSLRIEDAPGLEYVFNPHMWYVPNINEGVTTCSFDLRVGEGAIFWHEWRDQNNPYRVGPSFNVDAAGQLLIAKQPVLTVPHDQWVHFEATCGMGKQANGQWTLTVTLPGQQPQKFERLECDPKLRSLMWLGFVSNAEQKTLIYLDNIKLSVAKP